MFIYSKRTGTIAEKLEDNTSNLEKVKRLEKLKKMHEGILNENNEKMVGKTYKILIEGLSKNNNECYTGRTSTNKTVIFEANESLIGSIVDVKIESNHLWYLKGKIV
ncbi:(Dimethylallyl)adenosine tRNA methylthiotransferase MiaB [compost metagenome]